LVTPVFEKIEIMATTSLKLPDALKQRVKTLAELAGKSPHAFMLEAIAVEAERAEKYQAFLARGEASLKHYQETGIAYAAEEVHAFIRAELRGENPPRPLPSQLK